MKRLLIILILFVSPAIYGQSELNLNAAAGLSKFNDGEKSIPQFSWYLSVSHRVNLKKSFFVGSSLLIRQINIKKKISESLYCSQDKNYYYFVKSRSAYAGFLFTIGWDIGPVWFDISSNLTYPVLSKGKTDGLKKCVDNQITNIDKNWINHFYEEIDLGIQLGLGFRFTDRMSVFTQFYHGFVTQYGAGISGNNMQLVLGVKYSFKKSDQRFYKHK